MTYSAHPTASTLKGIGLWVDIDMIEFLELLKRKKLM